MFSRTWGWAWILELVGFQAHLQLLWVRPSMSLGTFFRLKHGCPSTCLTGQLWGPGGASSLGGLALSSGPHAACISSRSLSRGPSWPCSGFIQRWDVREPQDWSWWDFLFPHQIGFLYWNKRISEAWARSHSQPRPRFSENAWWSPQPLRLCQVQLEGAFPLHPSHFLSCCTFVLFIPL